MSVPLHPREEERLDALARLGVLDTPVEERFDRITRLAAHLLDAPVALVSLVDRDRQWFKSMIGLAERETPRELSFCAHAVADPSCEELIVPNALDDPRFASNPFVVDDPSIRAYAGHVVHAPDGMPVGTLCVVDTRVRAFGDGERSLLADLAAMVEDELMRTDELDLLRRIEESERSKHTLLDSVDQGMILFSVDGRMVESNRAAAEILRVQAADLLRGRVDDDRWDIVRADGSPWPTADQPVATVLRTGHSVDAQTVGVRAGDERRWLSMACRPIHAADGRLEAVAAVFTDITEVLRERADAAALTEQLRVAIEDSPLGTGLTDAVGNFTYLNAAYADLIGISQDEAPGRTSVEFIVDEDMPSVRDAFMEVIEGRARQFTRDLRIRDGRGELKFVRSHVTKLEPATPTAAYLVQIEDITSRRQLTDALRRSEEFARASLDGLDEGVMLVDRELHVLRMNAAAVDILGIEAAELSARLRSGEVTVWTEDGRAIPTSERAVARTLVSGETVRGDVVRWISGDRHRLLRISSSPITLDDGRNGAVVSFEDVTDQRAIELAVERYRILFRHATDMVAVIGNDGRLKFTSPSAQRILGWAPGWDHPEGVLALIHPEDASTAGEHLAALIRGDRQDDPLTVRIRTADGSWRHLELLGVNLLDEPAVRGVVVTGRDVTERQQLLDELAHQAAHDQLTGLPNRSLINEQLRSALARAAREGRHVALCYLDLDHFKSVNDLLGHAVGDDVLVTVGDRIRSAVRAGDTPARIGGDEFVVLLDPVHDTADAVQVAERLRDAILGDRLGAGPVAVGVSIGVAVSRPEDRPTDLLVRADAALYESKEHRNGTVVAASP